MAWITWDFLCDACGHVQPELVERGADVDSIRVPCKECGEPTHRTFSAINVTRASFVDGSGRLDKLKKRAKIKAEMFDLPPSKRGEHQKELKKLERMDKTKGSK